MIRAERVSFQVPRRQLLRDVDFSLAAGEMVVLLGPNGAGKSTLLKTLCGQIKPTSGRVLFQDRPLSDWNPRDLARHRAVLPQQSVVPFDFTGLEIVLLGRSPHGDSAACEAMAREAMRRTASDHLADRIVTTLSGGELQRIHLARVLVQIGLERTPEPRCLMLDEPISNLDPAHQHEALRVARQLAHDGAAVLVVLHDLNLAAQYADRLVVMKDGVLRASGTAREVLQPALIEKIFSVRAMVTENPTCPAPAVFVEP
jgi:iron complex transport system ATP-binding protein